MLSHISSRDEEFSFISAILSSVETVVSLISTGLNNVGRFEEFLHSCCISYTLHEYFSLYASQIVI